MSHHDPASTADIDHRFDFHPATTEEKRAEHGSVRAACRDLAHKFDRDLPPGREKALAITQLEQAMFWANAAIARARN
ncbi:Acb2/Tad1 domain-containing protein [Nocardia xishanensis]